MACIVAMIGMLRIVLAMLLMLSPVVALAAEPAALWEFAPYRVRVAISYDDAGGASDSRPDFTSALTSLSAADFGPTWDLQVIADDASMAGTVVRVDDPSPVADYLPDSAGELDKLIWVVARRHGDLWQLAARELDVRTRRWGAIIRPPRVQHELLTAGVWRAMVDAFQPLTIVDDVEKDQVRLRIRAAGLVESPAHPVRPQTGNVLRPINRLNARDGRVLTGPIEWTMLLVKRTSGSIADAQLFSGFRSPLGGRARGNTQTYALMTMRQERITELTVVSRTGHAPLPDYEIFVQSPPQTSLTLLGQTDDRGRIAITPQQSDLQLLIVKHGDEVLARVPIVAGADPAATLELPDDRERLEAEGLTIGLQEQIVDVIAKRDTLMMQTRQELGQGKLDEAKRLLNELQRLPSGEAIRAEIRNARLRLQSADPYVQAKIKRLFDDTEQVLKTNFDSRDLDQLEREVSYQREKK